MCRRHFATTSRLPTRRTVHAPHTPADIPKSHIFLRPRTVPQLLLRTDAQKETMTDEQ